MADLSKNVQHGFCWLDWLQAIPTGFLKWNFGDPDGRHLGRATPQPFPTPDLHQEARLYFIAPFVSETKAYVRISASADNPINSDSLRIMGSARECLFHS